jgi:hypothetical protein
LPVRGPPALADVPEAFEPDPLGLDDADEPVDFPPLG